MGAICGFFNLPGATRELLSDLTAAMARRGPDGVFHELLGPETGLGCCHLLPYRKIRPYGDPIGRTPDGKVWVAADADLANLEELRVLLPVSAEPLLESPAGLLARLHQKFGLEFLDKLRGSFALAIVDRQRDCLHLVRDRLGLKSLFWSELGEGVIFASELKALLATDLVPAAVSRTALHHFLAWGCVPAPATAFTAIRKLPPATILTRALSGPECVMKKYYDLAFLPKTTLRDEECRDRLRELVTGATKKMLADTDDFGCLLSDGTASSIVVGLLTRLTGKPVRAFAAGFAGEEGDGLACAREVAARHQAELAEFVIRPELVDLLPALVRAAGEPYADTAALPAWCAARLAGESTRVVALGAGGNDSFAGHRRYRAMARAARLDLLPAPLRRALAALGLKLIPASAGSPSRFSSDRRCLELARQPEADRYASLICRWPGPLKAMVFSDEFAAVAGKSDPLDFLRRAFAATDPRCALLDRLLATDFATSLPGELAVTIEAAAAAHRLLARAPFLDQGVVEFAATLPPEYKLKGKTGQAILKDAFREFVPDPRPRRRKTGGGVPVHRWFRSELNAYLKEQLLDSKLPDRGYFRKAGLEQLIREHESGAFDHGDPLWSILILELWHQEFIDAQG